MSTYLHGRGTRQTPQSEPIPGSEQVPNSAGGYVFEVDDFTRLERFLVLGSEGGTYYVSEPKVTGDNLAALERCVKADPDRAVQTIVDISTAGRNVKQEPVMFALAYCAGHDDLRARRAALAALPEVCRTGSHLLLFASYVEQFRGWGRSLRRAVGAWYARDVAEVAYQVTKYRQRYDHKHRDLLRLAHPGRAVSSGNPTTNGLTDEHARLFEWIKGERTIDEGTPYGNVELTGQLLRLRRELPEIVYAYERAQRADTPAETAALVREHPDLSREMLLTEHLTDPEVNRALLEMGMPMTALIRNLANLTRYGVLTPMGEHTQLVLNRLGNANTIRAARVHPYAMLLAQRTYALGYGMENPQNHWSPIPQIVDALDAAFYTAFDSVEPTGKRHVLGIDVSGSMGGALLAGVRNGRAVHSPVSCAEAAAAMAMVTARKESQYAFRGFADDFVDLGITANTRLSDALAKTRYLNFGRTDCALPMLWALQNGIEADVFVVYTDNETWYGNIHPAQALQRYREQTGIPAKLVVCAMTSTGFTIADPDDAGSMDVCGFDAAAPKVIADFVRA